MTGKGIFTMKRLILIVTLISLLAIISNSASADEWGYIIIPKGKSLKIGFGAALSGDYATLGMGERNGVEMAVSEKKSIKGFPLELEIGDDQCEGAPSVALAERFGADPLIVGVIGFMCSGGSIPASDALNRYKKVMISPSSTADALTARGLQNVFRTCWNDRIQGRVAAEFALKQGWKRAAVIHDKSAYGQGIADEFKSNFENGKGSVISYEGITRGDKDFRAILTKVRKKQPDVIYFGGMAAEGALISRQKVDVGIKVPMIGPDGLHDVKDFIEGGGESTEGQFVTFSKEPVGQKYKDWKARFEGKYKYMGPFDAHAYDAAWVLMKAIENVAIVEEDGSLKIGKKALADEIRKISHDGITGKIKFDKRGDRVGVEVVVKKVMNRKFVEVWP